MNTRISESLKLSGDAVLARAGLTQSDAVRALWQYMAANNSLPPFMQGEACGADDDPAAMAREGAGLALRLAHEVGLDLSPLDLDYDELREAAYEERLEGLDARAAAHG